MARRAPAVTLLLGLAMLGPALAAEERAGHPLLWRVERYGRTSHLFGTMHLGLDLESTLGEAGLAAADAAERVYVELDLTSPETHVEVASVTVNRAFLPEGKSLKALLRPEAWKRLEALSDDTPTEAIERMRPWFAMLTTAPRALGPARNARRHPRLILDHAIAVRAKNRDIKVVPLETPLEAIRGLVATDRQEGVAMLEHVLLRSRGRRQEALGLIGAYTSRDDRQVRKAFLRTVRRYPSLTEHLLYRRNERWLEHLLPWLVDTDVFLAAGAFHMWGERGLIALLRARGYRVERVRGVSGTPPP